MQDKKKIWEKRKKLSTGLIKENEKILNDFLKDCELGTNMPTIKKGLRSYGTLIKLRLSLVFVLSQFPKIKIKDITKVKLHKLFKDMLEGKIKKKNGQIFQGVDDYVKVSKFFFGWTNKQKIHKENISEDLARSDYSRGKPSWVYLGQDKMKTLIDNARGDYRALILFLYDSAIRPEEAYRLRISDFSEDYTLLNIPDKREDGTKVSKTFERTIKLKTCSNLLKSYIEKNKLKDDDLLIIPNPPAFNKYLKSLSKSLFGDGVTKARGKYGEINLYAIRHNAVCFWLDRYKTNKDLMYRCGWSREDKIFYYSEFLGRRDTIDDEDMMTLEDKNKYETEIEQLKKEIEKGKVKQEENKEEIKEIIKLEIEELQRQYGIPTSTIKDVSKILPNQEGQRYQVVELKPKKKTKNKN